MIVPPLAGMDGVGGWTEIYFSFTPIDDENHLWLITSHVEATGKDAEPYRAKRAEYDKKVADAPPVMQLVNDIWSGKLRYADASHPDLAIVQDIAVQAGQGRIEDRERRAPRPLGRRAHPVAKDPRPRVAGDRRRPSAQALEDAAGRTSCRRLDFDHRNADKLSPPRNCKAMEFGLFSNNRRPNRSLGDGWDEDIFEAEVADRLGLPGNLVQRAPEPGRADHRQGGRPHASASGWAPACGRSATIIRLQVALEANATDQLTGGRYMLGIGTGFYPRKLAWRGLDPDAMRAVLEPSIQLMLKLWNSTEPVDYDGPFWKGKQMVLEVPAGAEAASAARHRRRQHGRIGRARRPARPHAC